MVEEEKPETEDATKNEGGGEKKKKGKGKKDAKKKKKGKKKKRMENLAAINAEGDEEDLEAAKDRKKTITFADEVVDTTTTAAIREPRVAKTIFLSIYEKRNPKQPKNEKELEIEIEALQKRFNKQWKETMHCTFPNRKFMTIYDLKLAIKHMLLEKLTGYDSSKPHMPRSFERSDTKSKELAAKAAEKPMDEYTKAMVAMREKKESKKKKKEKKSKKKSQKNNKKLELLTKGFPYKLELYQLNNKDFALCDQTEPLNDNNMEIGEFPATFFIARITRIYKKLKTIFEIKDIAPIKQLRNTMIVIESKQHKVKFVEMPRKYEVKKTDDGKKQRDDNGKIMMKSTTTIGDIRAYFAYKNSIQPMDVSIKLDGISMLNDQRIITEDDVKFTAVARTPKLPIIPEFKKPKLPSEVKMTARGKILKSTLPPQKKIISVNCLGNLSPKYIMVPITEKLKIGHIAREVSKQTNTAFRDLRVYKGTGRINEDTRVKLNTKVSDLGIFEFTVQKN